MDHVAVGVRVSLARARRDAAVDVKLQAGALVRSRDGFRARTVREEFFQQVHRLADGARAGERAEVPRAVRLNAPREIHLRKRLGEVDLDVGISLVVLQPGVEKRLALLDEQILEQQSLLNRLRDDELEIRDAPDEGADARLLAVGRLEIGADAVAEARRLADVDDLAAAVLHQIDARLGGEHPEAVGELFGSRLYANAGSHRALFYPRRLTVIPRVQTEEIGNSKPNTW